MDRRFVVSAEPDAVAGFVADRLPRHMVPKVVPVDALPVTANGKIDRRQLRDRYAEETTRSRQPGPVEPVSALEAEIGGQWAKVLGVDDVGVDVDFLDAGGDSVSATILVTRLRAPYRTSLTIGELLECSTVRGLSALIARRTSPQPAAASCEPAG